MLIHFRAELVPSAMEESAVTIRDAADLVVHATHIAIAAVIGVAGVIIA